MLIMIMIIKASNGHSTDIILMIMNINHKSMISNRSDIRNTYRFYKSKQIK